MLQISWRQNFLTITGPGLPAEGLQIHYLEAFCRPGSTDRDWGETVIPHTTEALPTTEPTGRLRLRSRLADGVTVDHTIVAGRDEVDFRLQAHNPTHRNSEAHWAQPCIRVGAFTGHADREDPDAYIAHCFVFVHGELTPLPTEPWATEALYTPGQVWCPVHVPRTDVNPRPLSPLIPDHGLMGCFSVDKRLLLATAWEPYQELFQGVIQCIHADFRIGGLEPGERRSIRGKIYLMENDIEALLARYGRDFSEHGR